MHTETFSRGPTTMKNLEILGSYSNSSEISIVSVDLKRKKRQSIVVQFVRFVSESLFQVVSF